MNYMYFSREVKRVRSALNYSSGRPVFPMFVAARGMISSAALGGQIFPAQTTRLEKKVNDSKCTLQISQGVFGT